MINDRFLTLSLRAIQPFGYSPKPQTSNYKRVDSQNFKHKLSLSISTKFKVLKPRYGQETRHQSIKPRVEVSEVRKLVWPRWRRITRNVVVLRYLFKSSCSCNPICGFYKICEKLMVLLVC